METSTMGLIAFLMTAEIVIFLVGQMKYPLGNMFWLWVLIMQLVGNLIAMYVWLEERFLRKRFEHEIEMMSNERERHLQWHLLSSVDTSIRETLAQNRINIGHQRTVEWNHNSEEQNWLTNDNVQEEPEQKRPPAEPPNVLRNLLSRRKKN